MDSTAQHPALLDRYTPRQIAAACARVRCVKAYRRARAARPEPVERWVDGFIEELRSTVAAELHREYGVRLKISYRTLARWDRTFSEQGGVEKLIDSRGGDQRSQGDERAWAFFRSAYLSESRPTLKDAWRRTGAEAERQGWTWCSYDSCRRQLAKRIPEAARSREGHW